MEDLVKQLEHYGLTREQIKQVLTVITKWTNRNYPIMGTVVESILRKNQLIDPSC